MRTEGRVRRLRGSRGSPEGEMAEVQTAQSQPSVGMPMEVPLPRKVRVASIGSSGRCWATGRPGAGPGRAAGGWRRSGRGPG